MPQEEIQEAEVDELLEAEAVGPVASHPAAATVESGDPGVGSWLGPTFIAMSRAKKEVVY